MARTSLKITGMARLKRRLKKMDEDTAANTEAAIMGAAKIIRDNASQRVRKRTAILSKNIRIEVLARTGRWVIIHIGPDAKRFYGKFVERGTSKMPAYPYLRPAFDENQDLTLGMIFSAVRQGLK